MCQELRRSSVRKLGIAYFDTGPPLAIIIDSFPRSSRVVMTKCLTAQIDYGSLMEALQSVLSRVYFCTVSVSYRVRYDILRHEGSNRFEPVSTLP